MVADFFKVAREQSLVKSLIVSKYFFAWANVLKHKAERLIYLDLFAGPGLYEDGSRSTPLMILEAASSDQIIAQKLVALFNDSSKSNVETLKRVLEESEAYGKLAHKPRIWNVEIGDHIDTIFSEIKLHPTFFFADPWGYKILSLRLVNLIINNWGSECIFFFNYNRINMGLGNKRVQDHIDDLFGKERANDVRIRLQGANPHERERIIVDQICQILISEGAVYALPFTFRRKTGKRTSHHLIFVSKHPLGYEIMKEVMYRESSHKTDGIAEFEFNPAETSCPVTYSKVKGVENLKEELLTQFAGRVLTVKDVFRSHKYGTPYIMRNYKRAISELHDAGEIVTDRSSQNIRRGECPERVLLEFPK